MQKKKNGHIKIAKHPRIQVIVEGSQTVVYKISLKESASFNCLYANDIEASLMKQIICWLEHYSARMAYPLPIKLPINLPPFLKKVLTFLSEVPFGTFLSYSDIAKVLGSPNAARAVGNACHRNPYLLLIPCHRVLRKHSLGEFGPGSRIKKELFVFENNL